MMVVVLMTHLDTLLTTAPRVERFRDFPVVVSLPL